MHARGSVAERRPSVSHLASEGALIEETICSVTLLVSWIVFPILLIPEIVTLGS